MAAPALVEFRGVSLGYGARPVLAGLDFVIREGDFLGIVGPNGAGKTTILRGVLGLLRPLRGSVLYRGSPLSGNFHFGYVPQRQTVEELFPLSVHDVVLMGRYRRMGHRRVGATHAEMVSRSLAATGMEEFVHAPYRDLSGGQKQRVLIARALASEPEVLVLDEPTSGMDLAGEVSVMSLVDRLHRERRLTVVLVSHQLNTIAKWVHDVGILHEGALDVGPLDIILTTGSLERVYGKGARVVQLDGHRVVLPPERENA